MTSDVRPALLRRMNERKVLEVLQTHGPSSRADVTRLSGISAPTVSKAVAALLGAGLLEEREAEQVSQGRPGKLLRLATANAQVLGVVVGTRKCWIVSAGLDGKLHDEVGRSFDTPGNYEELLDAVARQAAVVGRERDAPALGVGVSMPGLFNSREQRTVFSPNLQHTNGRTFGRDLESRLGMETVTLQESHALCLSERTYGAAKGLDDFALLDIGDGLGLGVMSGGRLLQGRSGLAGELGHLTVERNGRLCGCGNRGCLETVATDASVAARASERLGRTIDFDELKRLSSSGAYDASLETTDALEYLAIAVSAVVNVFNPGVVFVHGRMLDLEPGLFERLLELTSARSLAPSFADCRIVRARGSKRQGAVAAVIHHLTSARGPAIPSSQP